MAELQLPGQSIETKAIFDRYGNEAVSVVTTDRLNGPDFMHFDPYKQVWVDGIVGDEVVYDKYIDSSMNPLFGLTRAIAKIRAATAVRKHLK
jgi:hypothetical protein